MPVSTLPSTSRVRPPARRLLLSALGTLALLAPLVHAPSAHAAGFDLVFSDNFDGTRLDTKKWGVFTGVKRSDRTAAHAIVKDGALTLRTQKVNGVWKGAGVSAGRSNNQRYGKYVMRVRFDRGYGVRVAGLLWPSNGVWPPEVDFYEIPASNTDRTLNTLTTHYGTRANHRMHHNRYTADFTQWQTVGVEWTPNKLVYTLNGRPMVTSTEHVPAQSMWFGIATRPGSHSGIVPIASTPPVVDLDIDWVKIYKYTP
jgi:beta-glucanase (GH16 family)